MESEKEVKVRLIMVYEGKKDCEKDVEDHESIMYYSEISAEGIIFC